MPVGYKNGVAHLNLLLYPVDFHSSCALKNKVKLLARIVPVAFGSSSGWKNSLGQALFFDRSVGAVEYTANG